MISKSKEKVKIKVEREIFTKNTGDIVHLSGEI